MVSNLGDISRLNAISRKEMAENANVDVIQKAKMRLLFCLYC